MTKFVIPDTQILLPYFFCLLVPQQYSFSREFSEFLLERQFEKWIIHYSIYLELGNLMKKFLGAELSRDCLDYIDNSIMFDVTSFDLVENELAKKIMVNYQYTETNADNYYSGIGIADASVLAFLKLKSLKPSRDSYKLLTYDRDLKDATRGEGLSSSVINFIPRPY
jgi:hypothetical protein